MVLPNKPARSYAALRSTGRRVFFIRLIRSVTTMRHPTKQLLWLLIIIAAATGLSGVATRCNRPAVSAAEQAHRRFLTDLAELDTLTNGRLLPLAQRSRNLDSLQRTFLACRLAYKRVEAFSEYYFASTSRLVNGPPLPEIEVEETKQFEPGGLQVIEEMLYPDFDTTQRDELVRQVLKLRQNLRNTRINWQVTELTDAHIFDVLRLEVFRIISLGISGFDTPSCRTAMPEAATALASIRTHLAAYTTKTPAFERLEKVLQKAELYLNQHQEFDSFDRAHFIITYANPLSSQLLAYQRQLGIAPFVEKRPLRSNVQTLFAVSAFDPDAYASTVDGRMNTAKVALGKRLFNDPVLSANNQRSCAGCHQPDKAFTDGLVKNKTITGQGLIGRNTPTLLNAALQAGQFYDLRAPSLESQSFDVVHNATEMSGNMEQTAQKLRAKADYVAMFRQAFPEAKGRIEPMHIQNAIASYERTLISLNSRFDQYMRGKKSALNAKEIHGFNLFMGKAKCGICHFMPLFNGTVPPGYSESESEVIGAPATAYGNRIDPDLGRYAHTKLDPLKYAFKTPTVRNVARTAPYMHNGVYRTLDEVVEFYNKGGGNGLGFNLDNQTLPFDKLNLTEPEKKALVAFMEAL